MKQLYFVQSEVGDMDLGRQTVPLKRLMNVLSCSSTKGYELVNSGIVEGVRGVQGKRGAPTTPTVVFKDALDKFTGGAKKCFKLDDAARQLSISREALQRVIKRGEARYILLCGREPKDQKNFPWNSVRIPNWEIEHLKKPLGDDKQLSFFLNLAPTGGQTEEEEEKPAAPLPEIEIDECGVVILSDDLIDRASLYLSLKGKDLIGRPARELALAIISDWAASHKEELDRAGEQIAYLTKRNFNKNKGD